MEPGVLQPGGVPLVATEATGSVARGAAGPTASASDRRGRVALTLQRYLAAAGLSAAATAVGGLFAMAGLRDPIAMLYVLAALFAAVLLGKGPAIGAAVLGVTAHAYFFVPPLLSLAITDVGHLLTLATLLVVAVVVGTLTAQLRAYADLAERRARHADALRSLSREFAQRRDLRSALRAAADQVAAHVGGRAAVLVTGPDGAVLDARTSTGEAAVSPADRSLASRVVATGRVVEGERPAEGAAVPVALPLEGARGTIGVLVVEPADAPIVDDRLRLVEGFARLTAEALERGRLGEQAQRAEVEARTERLRNALLSSVSHDFRTPLAFIMGAATHLAQQGEALDAATRTDLARTIEQEADRLNRLVGDVLAMTRLDAGAIHVVKEWQSIADVVGSALRRMETALRGRSVTVDVPPDLPLVPMDPLLIEQVMVNLLDNAAKHTPPDVPVRVTARAPDAGAVVVEVTDRGPGFEPGEEETVFEHFRRGRSAAKGLGLGLAVCRGLVVAHGGRIEARNDPAGGATFRFSLPLEGPAPSAPESERV